MSLMPDNFFYFITLFTISIIGGSFLFFTYRKSWLNYLNAAMFLACAFTIAFEYSFHDLASNESVVISLYGPITLQVLLLSWLCLFYYVKPFSNKIESEKYYHLFALFILIIPTWLNAWQMFERLNFEMNPELIDGYRTFRLLDNNWTIFYLFQTYVFGFFFTTALFIYSIWKNKENRTKQIMLALLFMLFPILYNVLLVKSDPTQWAVPNIGFVMLVQTFVLTWFIAGYRLFSDGFDEASGDLLNSISDLSIQTDEDLQIKNTNRKLNSTFGKPQNSLSIFLTQNSRYGKTETKEMLNNLINKNVESQEFTLIDKDGMERQFQMKVSDLQWRGTKKGHTFLLSDLSDTKSKEKELQELNNTKDQLFSVIAHDLRNPALAFKGITKRVNYLIKKKDFEVLNTLGSSIEKSAIQLNSLLDNLLKWSLTQRGSIEVNNQPVSVKALTQGLIESFEIITNEKEIAIDDNQVDKDLVFETDPELLETILRNLISNAIKYSDTDSKILLTAEQKNHEILITVKDFGQGMTQDQIEKLFKVYKGKSTYGTLGEKGSGLGLNLVHDLVTRTGGELICESVPKVGTEMKIRYKK